MSRKRRTVADMLALKGKQQVPMLCVDTLDAARAASGAGIDMLSKLAPSAGWAGANPGLFRERFSGAELLVGESAAVDWAVFGAGRAGKIR